MVLKPNWPDAHAEHDVLARTALTNPRLHDKQAEAPDEGMYDPASHGMQVVGPTLVKLATLYEPTAHAVQERLDPTNGEKVPDGHPIQSVPMLEIDPAGHKAHVLCPGELVKLPTGQKRHDAACKALLYCPVEQGVHCANPVEEAI